MDKRNTVLKSEMMTFAQGDYVHRIELSPYRANADATVLLAALKGRTQGTGAIDDPEVGAFCTVLSRFSFRSYADVTGNLDETPLPRGFSNVRMFDGYDGSLLGSSCSAIDTSWMVEAGADFRVEAERPTAGRAISICLCQPLEEVTEWRSTRALPTGGAGTLDLAVDIDIGPRRLLVDGTPLPDHLIRFMEGRARMHL